MTSSDCAAQPRTRRRHKPRQAPQPSHPRDPGATPHLWGHTRALGDLDDRRRPRLLRDQQPADLELPPIAGSVVWRRPEGERRPGSQRRSGKRRRRLAARSWQTGARTARSGDAPTPTRCCSPSRTPARRQRAHPRRPGGRSGDPHWCVLDVRDHRGSLEYASDTRHPGYAWGRAPYRGLGVGLRARLSRPPCAALSCAGGCGS
jgi:hypothetical protein